MEQKEKALILTESVLFSGCGGWTGWKLGTMKQYEVYVKLVKKELGSVPFEEIDEPTFREAVQKVRGESSRKGGIATVHWR